MTPRHLAMFCLTQLAGIAGGVMLAHKARKFYALWKSMGEDELPIPIAYEPKNGS